MGNKKIAEKARLKKLSKNPVSSPSLIDQINYPVFCLHYLANNKYNLIHCNKDEIKSCMNTLRIISQSPWQRIESNHVCGYHQINNKDSIKATRPEPQPMSPDLSIIAFEFGDNKKIVGYRRSCVFHIIWIDRDFTLYDHGS